MNEEDSIECQFSLYLKGDDLHPDAITRILGIEPTEAHSRGHTWKTSSNKQVVEKTGLWSRAHIERTNDVEVAFKEFLSALQMEVALAKLPGVEEAYLDVFVVSNPNELGGGENELILDPQCLSRLAALGLPLQLTFAVVGKSEREGE